MKPFEYYSTVTAPCPNREDFTTTFWYSKGEFVAKQVGQGPIDYQKTPRPLEDLVREKSFDDTALSPNFKGTLMASKLLQISWRWVTAFTQPRRSANRIRSSAGGGRASSKRSSSCASPSANLLMKPGTPRELASNLNSIFSRQTPAARELIRLDTLTRIQAAQIAELQAQVEADSELVEAMSSAFSPRAAVSDQDCDDLLAEVILTMGTDSKPGALHRALIREVVRRANEAFTVKKSS